MTLRHTGWSLFVLACLAPASRSAEVADTIYHNGPIVTVNDQQPTAEALAVRNGRILAVGSKTDVLKTRGDSTRVVNLAGQTMVPGFLDGHSHFINSLQVARQANCFAPPAGPGKSIADIIAALQQAQREFAIPKGEFIVGYGYDGDAITDTRQLTAADLDAAFPDNPVFVQHVSLHGAVCNSLALKKFHVTRETVTPKGGVILRKPGTTEPEGLLMETAWLPVFENLPKPAAEELLQRFEAGQQLYAAAGVTTAQEGATMPADVELLHEAARRGLLMLDVVSYPFITGAKEVLQKHPAKTFGKYTNHLKLGGIKITVDGSPQGRTAFFTTPYLTGGPGGEQNWRGEPSFPPSEAEAMIKFVYDNNLQLFLHCNGDAAIDMFLSAHEKVAKDRFADRRTTIIHSQFVRPDQLAKYQDYHIMASFFTEHCYYFGETHIRNRGRDQAFFLSPMKTALGLGIRCANHTDFNVSPIDQMFVLWSAVTRMSRGGTIIGPNERVTPLESLKALTIGAAHMYQEEATKGTLEPGKLADLVLLDQNPLTVDPMTIKEIRVMETIKEGKTIYRRK